MPVEKVVEAVALALGGEARPRRRVRPFAVRRATSTKPALLTGPGQTTRLAVAEVDATAVVLDGLRGASAVWRRPTVVAGRPSKAVGRVRQVT